MRASGRHDRPPAAREVGHAWLERHVADGGDAVLRRRRGRRRRDHLHRRRRVAADGAVAGACAGPLGCGGTPERRLAAGGGRLGGLGGGGVGVGVRRRRGRGRLGDGRLGAGAGGRRRWRRAPASAWGRCRSGRCVAEPACGGAGAARRRRGRRRSRRRCRRRAEPRASELGAAAAEASASRSERCRPVARSSTAFGSLPLLFTNSASTRNDSTASSGGGAKRQVLSAASSASDQGDSPLEQPRRADAAVRLQRHLGARAAAARSRPSGRAASRPGAARGSPTGA